MLTKETYKVELASELAVMAHDSEMADMSNPRGEIIGTVYYMSATAPDGTSFRTGAFLTEQEALTYYEHEAMPVPFWHEDYPEYGSKAYSAWTASHAHDYEWLANN